MLRGIEPVFNSVRELFGRHARMRGGKDFHQRTLASSERTLQVVSEDGLERLFFLPLRVLGGDRLHSVHGEVKLKVQRLLGPKRAVIVEGGNAVGHGNEVRRIFLSDCGNEITNRLFRGPFVP